MGATLNQDLFCLPTDIYDALGTEGAQLCVDDHHLATGQTITVRSAANQGDTTLQVTALSWPLLAGSVLEFDGGGLAQVAEVILTATAAVGATTLNVQPLAAAIPALAAAIDNGVNLALAQRLVKGCTYGTSQVKLYCCGRYEAIDLLQNAQQQGSVNRWATALGTRWVRRRRGQSAPQSLEEAAKEALEEMKMVRTGALSIENIGTRTAGWPFITNTTVDIGYDYRKVRVEAPISEGTPTQYGQAIDWNSALWMEL